MREKKREKLRCATTLAVMLAFLLLPFAAFASDSAFDAIIIKTAKRHNIDPLLIKALICRESSFDRDAVGGSGEIGLMQIKVCAAADWADYNALPVPSEEQMFDPEMNIEIGTWYLTRARDAWKDYKHCYILALCEYNAGRTGMKPWVPPRKDGKIHIGKASTRQYVNSILNIYLGYNKGPSLASSQ